MAKNSIGTALAGTAIYHALQGNITGSGPTSTKDRTRLEAQGWQPYSVKVGNKFVSYRKLEPIGTVLGLAADVAESMKSAGPAAGGLTKSLLTKVSRNMESAEFIGSLMRLNQIFESPGKYLRGLVGTAIPTGVADIAKATDRTVRAPDATASLPTQIKQQLESRIPGLTQNVPAVKTPQGQPLTRPASALGGFIPYPVSTGAPSLPYLEQSLANEQKRRQAMEARKQLIKERHAARK